MSKPYTRAQLKQAVSAATAANRTMHQRRFSVDAATRGTPQYREAGAAYRDACTIWGNLNAEAERMTRHNFRCANAAAYDARQAVGKVFA